MHGWLKGLYHDINGCNLLIDRVVYEICFDRKFFAHKFLAQNK